MPGLTLMKSMLHYGQDLRMADRQKPSCLPTLIKPHYNIFVSFLIKMDHGVPTKDASKVPLKNEEFMRFNL
jgi:hypothetical protein